MSFLFYFFGILACSIFVCLFITNIVPQITILYDKFFGDHNAPYLYNVFFPLPFVYCTSITMSKLNEPRFQLVWKPGRLW